ncbi:glycosyl hydrolase family 61-domain-containing protein [Mucidula mucida]|nr:glycosyl hydrolase family 61-domain-containing protein [Mucidula mucida]
MLTLIDIKCAADGRILPLSILPFSALLKASSFPSSLPLTTPELLAAHRRPIHYISSIITPINYTMKFLLASLPILAYAISSVSAHGYVNNVNIGGTDFSGSAPASGSTDGVVRVISTTSPVKGADNPSLNCGQDATAVSDIAKGSPGDVMAFSWNSGGGNWPHNTGPIITYMAECTNGDCTTFDTTSAEWFKIDEQGFDSSTNAWVQQTVMNGEPAYVTIPSTLAAGQYMVRHEIIALHLAQSDGGAEFYPSCTQLKVTGSQTGTAKSSEEVQFPGAYSDTDAGILIDAYSSAGTADYTFPGPQIASFVSGSSSGSNSGSDSDSGASAPLKKMKKRTAQLNGTVARVEKRNDALNRPRHVSRVMRGLDLASI